MFGSGDPKPRKARNGEGEGGSRGLETPRSRTRHPVDDRRGGDHHATGGDVDGNDDGDKKGGERP